MLHVAKRDDSGMFRDVYTLKTQGIDMVLPTGICGEDEPYFLMLDASCCQVYEMATGQPVYTMYFGSQQETYFLKTCLGFLDGRLYDLRFYESTAPTLYSMPELPALWESAQGYLRSDLHQRELSAQEKAMYFIED